MHDPATQSVLFPDLADKPVIARFDEPWTSSDGGLIHLQAIDQELQLTEQLADLLPDPRDSSQVEQSHHDLLRQRIYGLACGYEDANDAGRLRSDPLFRLALDRDPVDGLELGSQPTISRFENRVRRSDLMRVATRLLESVLDRQRERRGDHPRLITIDLDSTADPTHGNQQLSFFNAYYDTWCYLPLLAFAQFDDEPEQFLLTALLRPGKANDRHGFVAVLRRVLMAVIERFPRSELLVRVDAGFVESGVLDFLEAAGILYTMAVPSNSVLAKGATKKMEKVRRRAERTGETAKAYGAMYYQAGSWAKRRRVIYKAEVTCIDDRTPRDNARYVVTNLRWKAEDVYRFYCQRGDSENRIKELKLELGLARTSAHRFEANQLRVLMSVAAYVLLQELRSRLAGTRLAQAQTGRIRTMLIKIAARVERSARRIVVHLAKDHPARTDWLQLALAVGAVPT